MDIANLTKYNPPIQYGSGGASCEMQMINVPTGKFVKFEEAMEAYSNSLQQLKAEIATKAEVLHGWLERRDNFLSSTVGYEIVKELRKLSTT